ncbi:MAG TPA: hypothetical protein PLK25_06985 [Bacteroidales bacterium]|nr:hypothetical protein [Bacteroidales bacterium]HRC79438.1 hypothetical protein [Bacteroidales bacterium]
MGDCVVLSNHFPSGDFSLVLSLWLRYELRSTQPPTKKEFDKKYFSKKYSFIKKFL